MASSSHSSYSSSSFFSSPSLPPSSLPKLAIEGVDSVGILRAMVAAKRRSVEIESAEDLSKIAQIVKESNNNKELAGEREKERDEHNVNLLRSMINRKSSMIDTPSRSLPSSPTHSPISSSSLTASPALSLLNSTFSLASSSPSPSLSSFSCSNNSNTYSSSSSPSSPSLSSSSSPYTFWSVYVPSSAYMIILHHESKMGVQIGTSSRYGSFKYQDHTGSTFLCGGAGSPVPSEFGFVHFSPAIHAIRNVPGKFADFRIQGNHIGGGFFIQHKDCEFLLKLTSSSIVYRDIVLASAPVFAPFSLSSPLPSPRKPSVSGLRIDTALSNGGVDRDEVAQGFRDRNRSLMRTRAGYSPSSHPPPPPPLSSSSLHSPTSSRAPPPPPLLPATPHYIHHTNNNNTNSSNSNSSSNNHSNISSFSDHSSFVPPTSPSSRHPLSLFPSSPTASSSCSSTHASYACVSPTNSSSSLSSFALPSPTSSTFSSSPPSPFSSSSSASLASSSGSSSSSSSSAGVSHIEAASSSELLRELIMMRDRLKTRAETESETKGHHRRGDSEVPRMLQRLHTEVSEAEPSARLVETMEALQRLLKTRHEEEADALQKLMDDQMTFQRLKSAEDQAREETARVTRLLEGRGGTDINSRTNVPRSASFSHSMRTPVGLHARQLSSSGAVPRVVRAKGPVDDMFRVVTSTRRGCFQFGCDNHGRMHELVWHPTKHHGQGPEQANIEKPQLKDAETQAEVLAEVLKEMSEPLPSLRPAWGLLRFSDRWGELMTAKEWKLQSEQPYSAGATETMKLTSQWQALLAEWPKMGVVPSKSHVKKMKTLASRGIPNHLRGQVWFRFSGGLAKMENNRGVYDELSRLRAHEFIEIQLRKDITRTYPNHKMFRNVDGQEKGSGNGQEDNDEVYSSGQMLLFKVLKNLAIRNPHVGYCQGMGFSCALFLMYMPEEAAFWTMNQVLLADKYSRVADLYVDGFPLLFQAFHILERLTKKFVPKLHDYFEEASLTTMTYATKWFQMIYAEFPRELVVAIWDVFLCEGWRILYRVAIAILLIKEKQLLSASSMELLELMHDLPQDPSFRDTHAVMSTVMKVDITAKELKKLEMEYGAELASRPDIPPHMMKFAEGSYKHPANDPSKTTDFKHATTASDDLSATPGRESSSHRSPEKNNLPSPPSVSKPPPPPPPPAFSGTAVLPSFARPKPPLPPPISRERATAAPTSSPIAVASR